MQRARWAGRFQGVQCEKERRSGGRIDEEVVLCSGPPAAAAAAVAAVIAARVAQKEGGVVKQPGEKARAKRGSEKGRGREDGRIGRVEG